VRAIVPPAGTGIALVIAKLRVVRRHCFGGALVLSRVLCLAPLRLLLLFATSAPAGAATLPPGFQDSTVISGLARPTVVQFSSDGRIFVAEKSGTRPTIFADLTSRVDNYGRVRGERPAPAL
jgi:hypothetical protein